MSFEVFIPRLIAQSYLSIYLELSSKCSKYGVKVFQNEMTFLNLSFKTLMGF